MANSVDPEQTPHSAAKNAATDLDLHFAQACLFKCLGLLWYCDRYTLAKSVDPDLMPLIQQFLDTPTVSGDGLVQI